MHNTDLWSKKGVKFSILVTERWARSWSRCTKLFFIWLKVCIVLVFSVLAFSILAKCAVSYLPFPYLRFLVLAFSAPPVNWIHLTGQVDKSLSRSCQIFSEFNTPKITKIGQYLTELFKKIKRWTFLGTGYTDVLELTVHKRVTTRKRNFKFADDAYVVVP